jgi:hypothetical protein
MSDTCSAVFFKIRKGKVRYSIVMFIKEKERDAIRVQRKKVMYEKEVDRGICKFPPTTQAHPHTSTLRHI